MKKAPHRRYVLKARGDKLAATRARIVEATMQLHQEVGPRHTTISAIAARAGVERLTVYRHFPDEAAVFAACSRHYTELNPPPHPTAWAGEIDPRRRARRMLTELYAYFSRTAPMLEKILRDADDFPALRKIMTGFDGYLQSLAADAASVGPKNASAERRTHVLRHATRFETWRTLAADRIADAHKVELILDWLLAV